MLSEANDQAFGRRRLVIDGQQRLTSLYAVMRGVEVVDKDGSTRKITIAFRPRDGRFEVADAAIRNDPEFLPNVTELWSGTRPKPQLRRDLINALRDKGRAVDEKYEDAVERNLDRAHSIADYRFPTVDIRKTATTQDEEATEEDVAEIFVRINNQGTRLGQADFVLTLLSVYHGELRDRIEERSRAMSQGTVVSIDTQQLLRAVCGVAFGRARMSAVYRYLRGVDPTTGEADAAGRLERLSQLDDAAKECMEPTPWRDYLLRVQHAGFVNPGAHRIQERDRQRLCLLHPRPKGRGSEEQARRADRALGVRDAAYGSLLRVVGDDLRTGLGAGCRGWEPDDARRLRAGARRRAGRDPHERLLDADVGFGSRDAEGAGSGCTCIPSSASRSRNTGAVFRSVSSEPVQSARAGLARRQRSAPSLSGSLASRAWNSRSSPRQPGRQPG